MPRKFVGALVALLVLGVGLALAEEVKGKIKTIDADKGAITVTVDGKDVDFKVADDTQLVNGKGKEIKDRLKNKHFKEGANVVITTDKKAGKEVVTKVTLGGKK